MKVAKKKAKYKSKYTFYLKVLSTLEVSRLLIDMCGRPRETKTY